MRKDTYITWYTSGGLRITFGSRLSFYHMGLSKRTHSSGLVVSTLTAEPPYWPLVCLCPLQNIWIPLSLCFFLSHSPSFTISCWFPFGSMPWTDLFVCASLFSSPRQPLVSSCLICPDSSVTRIITNECDVIPRLEAIQWHSFVCLLKQGLRWPRLASCELCSWRWPWIYEPPADTSECYTA